MIGSNETTPGSRSNSSGAGSRTASARRLAPNKSRSSTPRTGSGLSIGSTTTSTSTGGAGASSSPHNNNTNNNTNNKKHPKYKHGDDGGIVVLEYNHVSSDGGMSETTATAIANQQSTLKTTTNPPDLSPLLADDTTTSAATTSVQYEKVCHTCFQLTQFASHGSAAAAAESGTSPTGIIRHDASYTERTRAALSALMTCVRQSHGDRRSRIVALQTLALVARAAYGATRTSSWWYTTTALPQRQQQRLDDEIGSDVPQTLVTIALDDPDEGIAAAAFTALTRLLLLSPNSSRSPYAPSLRSVTDDPDSEAVAWELWDRVATHVLVPRCANLLERALRLGTTRFQAAAVPLVTQTCLHMAQRHASVVAHADRLQYSKRWMELDVVSLCQSLVTGLLLPLMQHSGCSGHMALVAAQATVQWLEHSGAARALSHLPQQTTLSEWAVIVFQEQLTATSCTETRLQLLSLFMTALRHSPRTNVVAAIGMVHEMMLSSSVGPLSSTVPAPTAANGALRLSPGVWRRPARITLWTELAIYFFWCRDGGESGSGMTSSRSLEGTTTTTTNATTIANNPSLSDAGASLQAFLTSAALTELLSDSSKLNKGSTVVLPPRDEIVLTFCQTAIYAGRRLRGSNSSSSSGGGDAGGISSSYPDLITAWLQRTWVVLSVLASTVTTAPAVGAYLDEHLSLRAAGLASYVQLLQEYWHCSMNRPCATTSIALHLCGAAYPPHILWDRLAESAAYLTRLEQQQQQQQQPLLDESTDSAATFRQRNNHNANHLFDEFVARENKYGLASHHVRLHVLALAVDHWVQGRVTAIQQYEAAQKNNKDSVSPPPPSDLNMASAREMLRALAPKRLLSKILAAHVPPVDLDGKSKRDPMKKLALEHVRVSVAGIETMALQACDWRRRFGSSQETKQIMSVAVGLLQGKVDDTPMDDFMKAVLAKPCDSAVHRIHAFYEGEEPQPHSRSNRPGWTPVVSEQVTQPVKLKIKPLVSSSKLMPRPSDEVQREYLMQLCRQMVDARLERAVLATPLVDSASPTMARPNASSCGSGTGTSIPPIAAHRDGRCGPTVDAAMAWGHAVHECTAPSDPAHVVVACVPRQFVRYDGQDDFGLVAVMRVHNTTPIDFVDGVRLELGLMSQSRDVEEDDDDESDAATRQFKVSLGWSMKDFVTEPLSSMESVFPQELKSGEYITWEVPLKDLPTCVNLHLVPSVVYRNVPMEAHDAGATWVGEENVDASRKSAGASKGGSPGSDNVSENDNNSGEDDFQVTMSSNDSKAFKAAEIQHIRLSCETVLLPPLNIFQPCSLVFFNDRCGDVDSFRLLWFRFPHQLEAMNIRSRHDKWTKAENPISRSIAKISLLNWEGEAIPGGVATNLWAFMTRSGHRMFCVQTENDDQTQQTLHFRGDDRAVLYAVAGSKTSRESVVASLLPGMMPVA